MSDERCPMCGNSGWTLDCDPTREPVCLELIPCVYPPCDLSGRAVESITLYAVGLHRVARHPSNEYVMSVAR
jgi:hypothetical protein